MISLPPRKPTPKFLSNPDSAPFNDNLLVVVTDQNLFEPEKQLSLETNRPLEILTPQRATTLEDTSMRTSKEEWGPENFGDLERCGSDTNTRL